MKYLSCRTSGFNFFVIGLAFGVIALSGQPNFWGAALGCSVVGVVSQVRTRRKSAK